MNRRNLLRSAPAVGFAALLMGAAPVIAAAPTETPIMALYAEWSALFDRLETAGREELGDDLYDAEVDRRIAMEDRVTEMQPVTVQDVYAKILILTMHGFNDLPGPDYCPQFWNEAQAAIAA